MVQGGKKVWYFADGYLPAKNPASKMDGRLLAAAELIIVEKNVETTGKKELTN